MIRLPCQCSKTLDALVLSLALGAVQAAAEGDLGERETLDAA